MRLAQPLDQAGLEDDRAGRAGLPRAHAPAQFAAREAQGLGQLLRILGGEPAEVVRTLQAQRPVGQVGGGGEAFAHMGLVQAEPAWMPGRLGLGVDGEDFQIDAALQAQHGIVRAHQRMLAARQGRGAQALFDMGAAGFEVGREDDEMVDYRFHRGKKDGIV